jgi:hypothetical protein
LSKRLHPILGDNFIICRNIIEDINEKLADLRKDLEQFDVFWDRKSKVSTSHAAPMHNACRAVEDIASLLASDSQLIYIAGRIYQVSDSTLERGYRRHS